MRQSVQTELAAAFNTDGIQGFRDKASFFAGEIQDQFLPIFTEMTGDAQLAQQMVDALKRELGLLPEQVEVQVRLSQIEAARGALEIFKGDIEKLPPEVSTNIKTLWAKGDTIAGCRRSTTTSSPTGKRPSTSTRSSTRRPRWTPPSSRHRQRCRCRRSRPLRRH